MILRRGPSTSRVWTTYNAHTKIDEETEADKMVRYLFLDFGYDRRTKPAIRWSDFGVDVEWVDVLRMIDHFAKHGHSEAKRLQAKLQEQKEEKAAGNGDDHPVTAVTCCPRCRAWGDVFACSDARCPMPDHRRLGLIKRLQQIAADNWRAKHNGGDPSAPAQPALPANPNPLSTKIKGRKVKDGAGALT